MRGEEKLKSKVAEWVIRAGFRVEEAKHPLPPGADWGLEIQTPPPTIRLYVIHFAQRSSLVLGIGIGFSREHLSEITKLEPHERVKLYARLMYRLMALCPSCRVSIRPSPVNPERVIVETSIFDEDVGPSLVGEALTRLVNAFITVNTVLWEAFPSTAVRQSQQSTSTTSYM